MATDKDRNARDITLPGFARVEVTHDTTSEFRAIARIDTSDHPMMQRRTGDTFRIGFDIYGGEEGRGGSGDVNADCHISVEYREWNKRAARRASAVMTLEQMKGLRALLDDAINRGAIYARNKQRGGK
jgi:hypothetical protein